MTAPRIEDVLDDPAVSYWLKNQLRALLLRDAVDATHDAELLARIMRDRLNKLLPRSAT